MEVCNYNEFLKTLCGGQDFSQALLCLDCWGGGFWGEVMDETLGCRVISPVSVGAGTTRILNRYELLNYFWEHEYIQSLATYQTREQSWY